MGIDTKGLGFGSVLNMEDILQGMDVDLPRLKNFEEGELTGEEKKDFLKQWRDFHGGLY